MVEDNIPKLFHQFFWNGEVPEDLKPHQASLMRHHMNTEWKWRGWTRDSFVAFVEEHYQQFVAIFSVVKHPYQVIQLARYIVLYHFGGVTVDLDLEFFQNIENYLKGAELVLVRAYPFDWMNLVGSVGIYGQHGIRHCSTLLSNKLMASRPKNPFWLKVIANSIPRIYRNTWLPTVNQEVHWATGSYVLSDTFVAGPWTKTQRVILLPSTFLEPCRFAPMWKAITGFEGPCAMSKQGEWTTIQAGTKRMHRAVVRDHHAEDWTTASRAIPTILSISAAVILVLILRSHIQKLFARSSDEL